MWRRIEERYPHFCKRPLIAGLPWFFAGLLAFYSPWFLLLLPVGVLLCRHFPWVCLTLFALGILRGLLLPSPGADLVAGRYEVVGTVAETPHLRLRSQTFVLDTPGRKIVVTARASQWLMAGDRVRVVGEISPVKGDSREYWLRRGVSQTMYVVYSGSVELLEPGKGFGAIGSEWRTTTWARLRAHLDRDRAGLAMGIVAGQQGLVPQETHHAMKRAGTMHLLATSGFNVLLLAGMLMVFLSHLPVPRWAQCGLAVVLLVIYCFAVGSKPPVMRATTMAVVFFGIQVFGRTPDGLSLLAFAAIALAILEPATVLDAGYQLSFFAVASLILFFPAGHRWLTKKTSGMRNDLLRIVGRYVGGAMLVTLIAQMGSAPILAAHFGQFSIISPLSNLFTAAAVPFVYLGVGLGQVFSYVWQPLSYGFDFWLAGSACAWIEGVNSTLAEPSWSFVEFSPIPTWLAIGLLGGILLSSKEYVVRAEEMSDEVIL